MRTAIAAALVCISCSHPAPPAVPVVENRVALVATGHPIEDALDYLPVTSELVAAIDFQRLVRGPMWQRFVEPEVAKRLSQLAEFKKLCGFDPIQAVTHIAVGASDLGDKPGVTVLIQGPERTMMSTCMAKLASPLHLVQDGTGYFMTTPDGRQLGITFVGEHTMLLLAGPSVTPDDLAQRTSKRDSLKKSPKFTELFHEVDQSRTAWLVVNGNAKFLHKVGLPVPPAVIFGTLDVVDGIALDLRFRLSDPLAAAQLTSKISGGLAQLRTFVDEADVVSDGSDSHLTAKLSTAKLALLTGLFGGVRSPSPPPNGLGGGVTP